MNARFVPLMIKRILPFLLASALIALGGGAHAERHCFPVKDGSVRDGSFNAVADGVAEIEQSPDIQSFQFIIFYNAGLNGHVPGD